MLEGIGAFLFDEVIGHFPRVIDHFPDFIGHFRRVIDHFPAFIDHFPRFIDHSITLDLLVNQEKRPDTRL